MKRSNPDIQHFLTSELHRPLDKQKTLNKGQIIQAVKEGSLFGCVECDIRVPHHLKSKFSEMCPIFKNVEISRDDIAEYMKNFGEEHGIMNRPRHSLIGSFYGEQILLATPLLKWYLDHGLEVTKIYQVIDYTPVLCFKPFGEALSDARRAGDVDPNKAIIADTMKLVGFVLLHYPPPTHTHTHYHHYHPNRVFCVTQQIILFLFCQVGNSGYGKTITDQEKHRQVKFCDDTKASQLINTPFFRKIDEIDKDTFEVQSCNKAIKLNLPLQIGFFVYQNAKLRMLQFYYDFLDKYLDMSDF